VAQPSRDKGNEQASEAQRGLSHSIEKPSRDLCERPPQTSSALYAGKLVQPRFLFVLKAGLMLGKAIGEIAGKLWNFEVRK
jgi:hypothetical protein